MADIITDELDLSRVHKFRKDAVKDLSNDLILKSLCREVWVFGSSISGASDKEHTAFSDIDIAVWPNDESDICSPMNNQITKEINFILRKKYNFYYDIIWMVSEEMDSQPVLYNNIMKGLRII